MTAFLAGLVVGGLLATVGLAYLIRTGKPIFDDLVELIRK